MHVEHETIPVWPLQPTKPRQASRFRMSYPGTLQILLDELEKAGTRRVTLQTGVEFRHVRRDGWPRADAAKPPHPGVVLTFQTWRGEQFYPCDEFETWQANLHAIAKTLEALRDVDRWGATKGRQYQGMAKALPAGDGQGSREQAEQLIRRLAGTPNGSVKETYRIAVRRCSPDVGGDEATFRQLKDAYEQWCWE